MEDTWGFTCSSFESFPPTEACVACVEVDLDLNLVPGCSRLIWSPRGSLHDIRNISRLSGFKKSIVRLVPAAGLRGSLRFDVPSGAKAVLRKARKASYETLICVQAYRESHHASMSSKSGHGTYITTAYHRPNPHLPQQLASSLRITHRTKTAS